MRTLFVLAYFVFALSLRAHAADEQTVTVKNVSIAKDDVSVQAELQGKSIHLWCSTSSPFCAEPASGEYSVVRAVTADDAIYQDCTDVVLFKSSGVTKEKVGVYCWLDSGDCYMLGGGLKLVFARSPLTCPRVTPTIARLHDRPNHLALPHHREAGRRWDGRGL